MSILGVTGGAYSFVEGMTRVLLEAAGVLYAARRNSTNIHTGSSKLQLLPIILHDPNHLIPWELWYSSIICS